MKIKGFKYGVGDVVVPNNNEAAIYLQEIVIDDIHPDRFMYTVVDKEGDQWQASPIMLENDFILKECV